MTSDPGTAVKRVARFAAAWNADVTRLGKIIAALPGSPLPGERAGVYRRTLTITDLNAILDQRVALAAKLGRRRDESGTVWLAKRNEELRDSLTVAVELLDRLAAHDGCEYDHNDYCQAHGLHRRPCPHPLARQLVDAFREVQNEGGVPGGTS